MISRGKVVHGPSRHGRSEKRLHGVSTSPKHLSPKMLAFYEAMDFQQEAAAMTRDSEASGMPSPGSSSGLQGLGPLGSWGSGFRSLGAVACTFAVLFLSASKWCSLKHQCVS